MPNLQLALLKALGAFAVFVVCCAVSYYYGGKNQRNADAADLLAGTNAAMQAGRIAAQVESAVAFQEALQQAKSRDARRAAADALTTELSRHEDTACSLDPADYDSLLTLYRSVDATGPDPAPAAGGGHGAGAASETAPQPEGNGFGIRLKGRAS